MGVIHVNHLEYQVMGGDFLLGQWITGTPCHLDHPLKIQFQLQTEVHPLLPLFFLSYDNSLLDDLFGPFDFGDYWKIMFACQVQTFGGLGDSNQGSKSGMLPINCWVVLQLTIGFVVLMFPSLITRYNCLFQPELWLCLGGVYGPSFCTCRTPWRRIQHNLHMTCECITRFVVHMYLSLFCKMQGRKSHCRVVGEV